MTPSELILMHLVIRPMGHNELMRATGLSRAVLGSTLKTLEGDSQIWRRETSGREWTLGSDPLHAEVQSRDFSIQREEVGTGHVVVRFGDKWRPGHAQKLPATPYRGNALGNIYA